MLELSAFSALLDDEGRVYVRTDRQTLFGLAIPSKVRSFKLKYKVVC